MDSRPAPAVTAAEALARYFGMTVFRPGQEEAIATVTAGGDALVIIPTGGGKSMIYQIAALLLPGTALVVSPLIALMRDQVTALRERGYPGIAALHSQVPEAEQRATLAALAGGALRLLYVTPERCAQAEFLSVARTARISLIAVDEAHCISQWGHDFRPEYQLLDDAARALGCPPILALTATATPPVREDIVERLELRRPRLIVRGFDRPNLFYEVYPVSGDREKGRLLARLLAEGEATYPPPLDDGLARASAGNGLIYTALTTRARAISQALNRAGVHTAYYHGRLKAGQRNAVQDRFRAGAIRAIAATNAFGLGIDLPDLRFVVHHDAPPSLEAYYQESGRSGRDGRFARCPLLFDSDDRGRVGFMAGSGMIEAAELERAGALLAHAPARGVTRAAMARESGLSPARMIRALELLVAVGAVRERGGRYRLRELDAERVRQAMERQERRRAHDRTRLEMVRAYAQADGCRRQFLLQYFGDYDAPGACGMCDRCVPRTAVAAPAPQAAAVGPDTPAVAPVSAPFHPGDAVEHTSWGTGMVQRVTEDTVTAHFPEAGYRTLDLATVVQRGLLRRVTLGRGVAG